VSKGLREGKSGDVSSFEKGIGTFHRGVAEGSSRSEASAWSRGQKVAKGATRRTSEFHQRRQLGGNSSRNVASLLTAVRGGGEIRGGLSSGSSLLDGGVVRHGGSVKRG